MDHLNFLTRMPLTRQLQPAVIQALIEEMETRTIPAGTTLFSLGDPGDALYFIVSGRMRVSVQAGGSVETIISEVGSGGCVGEMALLTSHPRSATVTAIEDSELLRLTKSAFDRLSNEYPDLLTGLANQLLPRFQENQNRVALKNLFGDLGDALLLELLKKLDCRHLDSGQSLFRQGELGDEMYAILQGRLRVVSEHADGSQSILGEVGAGESLGEFVLLYDSGSPESRRSATVYATRSTDMVVITRQIFEDLTRHYPEILLRLTRKMAQRVAAKDKPAPKTLNNVVVTVVPVQAGQSIHSFAEQLKDSLTALGPTLFFNEERFDRYYGRAGASETPLDHPLSMVINAWLDERESEHRFTIYTASPVVDNAGGLTSWARRCLEDADIILLVGESKADPKPGAIEQALAALQARSRLELVLIHPSDSSIPTGSADWLSPRRAGRFPVQAHHHVRLGNPADFRRLARRLVGKPIGLALAGGGARGWAHLGVLRALEELNIEVDWVAGASMGAIMASGCALDWTSQRLRELASTFSNSKKLLDYTLPYSSLTSTKRITTLLQELFGGANVEDTWRPFFCIAADLTNGRETLQTSGPLWKAVRASMAFPGVFAPILDNEGCVLIDGGAVNNVPVDRMREMCPTGTVIGVDLFHHSPVRGKYDFGPSLSGWQVLKSRLLPFTKRVEAPNLIDIINGLVYSNNRYRLNETWRAADLLIRVPVDEFGLLDFDKYAEIIEVGYKAAQEQLKGFTPG